MCERSSLPPFFTEVTAAFGRYRLPVLDNRNVSHLLVETPVIRPFPGRATGWHSCGGWSTPTSGIFRSQGLEWRPGSPTRFIGSTRRDGDPQYSPDGKRVAFESDRGGVYAIWVSNADGSNAVELFSQPGSSCGHPSWSPDGQRIAFNFDAGGNTDIHVIRASGGKPVRLTTYPGDDEASSWSRDGNWIYFTSRRAGRWEVWKVPVGGGDEVKVTRNGGSKAFESVDGKFLYYTKAYDSSGLWKMPMSGGEESQVLPSVVEDSFSLVSDGIYFIPECSPDQKFSIQFLTFATGKVRPVAPIPRPPAEGLCVSMDGWSLLFSQLDEEDIDLMLVENFR
jgi:Tol biopolymer transport system component